jgi:tripartite-type tricarboxylate transporter receptor subunit TctC
MSSTKVLTFTALMIPFFAINAAYAQQSPENQYPTHAIKIVVPVSAGGGADTIARILAEKLQQRWSQPVLVENRTGAGGNVGAESVASAAPDGYTLLSSIPGPLTINSILYKKLNFDPVAFEPIAMLAFSPMVLAVRKDFPANTISEFIAYAKANPGKVIFASQGNATTSHLSLELLQQVSGTKFTHVPYRGTAPAAADLIGGHVDALFGEVATLISLHNAGLIRILAIATSERLSDLPNTPTLQEHGLGDFRAAAWFGFVAPAKTPAAITAKLNAAVNEILKMPDVRSKLAAIHMQARGGTPADLIAYIREETTRWGDVIRRANVKLD